MNHQRLRAQREALAGKSVIGIDPAKDKHQAAVVDAQGNQRGASCLPAGRLNPSA